MTSGSQGYRVVCGAPNLEAGRLYPFAPPGAVICGGRDQTGQTPGHRLRRDAAGGRQLGLSPDHVGLMDLAQDLPLGQDLAAVLNLSDVVLEVAVTANRSDCLSILGLAREVAALLDVPLRHPEIAVAPDSEGEPLQAGSALSTR